MVWNILKGNQKTVMYYYNYYGKSILRIIPEDNEKEVSEVLDRIQLARLGFQVSVFIQ